MSFASDFSSFAVSICFVIFARRTSTITLISVNPFCLCSTGVFTSGDRSSDGWIFSFFAMTAILRSFGTHPFGPALRHPKMEFWVTPMRRANSAFENDEASRKSPKAFGFQRARIPFRCCLFFAMRSTTFGYATLTVRADLDERIALCRLVSWCFRTFSIST